MLAIKTFVVLGYHCLQAEREGSGKPRSWEDAELLDTVGVTGRMKLRERRSELKAEIS
jgi:hypothetical protein